MEVTKEQVPKERKYPQRKRTKIIYTEFEMSMEDTSKKAKHSKIYTHSLNSNTEHEEKNENIVIHNIDDEELSEYEKLRLKNLEENRKLMVELGLINPCEENKSNVNKKGYKWKAKPAKTKVESATPIKRSLRLLKKTPDGKDIPLDLFQDSPLNTPIRPIREETNTRLEEEELPMNEDGENTEFLDRLKLAMSDHSLSPDAQIIDSLVDDMRKLKLAAIERIHSSRIQSMCVHPMESSLLIISGSKDGQLGLWNVREDQVVEFKPHVRALNCVTANSLDPTKLYTTSHDGTVRKADLNKSVFDLVYQTDERSNMSHLTWHSEIDANTLLIAHGNGEAAVLDLRTKQIEHWFHCHARSIRTVHLHPKQPHYFLSASGIGESKIWDLRVNKKHTDEFIGTLTTNKKGKGLTSAFFSQDGNKIATTCNDDYIRIYDSSDLGNPVEVQKVMHDNHTGRWLSVFKTVWHPFNNDLLFVGSMLLPRRIQLYHSNGHLMRELKDEQLTTVLPVISLHPSQSIVVGGNSTGKAHLFCTPELESTYQINMP